MTVDMTFSYNGIKYYLDVVDFEYSILTTTWEKVAANKNFLTLLNTPIKEWDGKSFHELINDFEFENYIIRL